MANRPTELAEAHFRNSEHVLVITLKDSQISDLAGSQLGISRGLADCAVALRDIYNKLTAMDAKLDALARPGR